MTKDKKDQFKDHMRGIIAGLQAEFMKDVDVRFEEYVKSLFILVDKGENFTEEHIQNQFSTSYDEISDNIVRLMALSMIDRDNCKDNCDD